ncbi:MAG: hypothetical protein SFY67_02250 [Candidatus Melainabacteria bacterium]|nr:hypothetical protein [Candidatus Melainabacteria bacterium]
MQSKERVKVIEAINSFNLKVVPEEIAVAQSLPLSVVSQELNSIASETGGNLRVSETGKIEYLFKPSFEDDFVKNVFKNTGQAIWNVLSNIFMSIARMLHLVSVTAFRVSIGLILILSVVIIIALIILAILRVFSSSDSDSDLGGAAEGIGYAVMGVLRVVRWFVFDWIFDWWYWDRYYFGPYRHIMGPTSYGRYRNDRFFGDSDFVNPFFSDPNKNIPTTQLDKWRDKNEGKEEESKVDFLTVCYQLVFGGINPNLNLEERYWKSIGATISNNKGVVVAEQLAPFTGKEEQDEDWMLPILARFEGYPEVSETGNIIYVFPRFRPERTAFPELPDKKEEAVETGSTQDQLQALLQNSRKRQASHKTNEIRKIETPKYLKEETIPFVDFPSSKLTPAVALGFVSLLGSLFLLVEMSSLHLTLFAPVIIFFVCYSIFFLGTPLLRHFFLTKKNEEIETRNNMRFDLAAKVDMPKGALQDKLYEASQVRANIPFSQGNANEVAYTTEKDVLEQDFQ